MSLAVQSGRIMHMPENVQQFIIGNHGWVIRDLNGFCSTSSPGTNSFIRRVGYFGCGLPRDNCCYPFESLENRLCTPEASACKRGGIKLRHRSPHFYFILVVLVNV